MKNRGGLAIKKNTTLLTLTLIIFAMMSAVACDESEDRAIDVMEQIVQDEYEHQLAMLTDGKHDYNSAFVDFAEVDLEGQIMSFTNELRLFAEVISWVDYPENVAGMFNIPKNETSGDSADEHDSYEDYDFPPSFVSLKNGKVLVPGETFGFQPPSPKAALVGDYAISPSVHREILCQGMTEDSSENYFFRISMGRPGTAPQKEVLFEGSARELCYADSEVMYFEKLKMLAFKRPGARHFPTPDDAQNVARMSNLRLGGDVYFAKSSSLTGDATLGKGSFDGLVTSDNLTYIEVSSEHDLEKDLGAPVYYVRKASDRESQVVLVGFMVGSGNDAMYVLPAEIVFKELGDVISVPYTLESPAEAVP